MGHFEKAIKSSYENALLKYDDYVAKIIQIDDPARRLEIYCLWHGFKGYAHYFYLIATDQIPECKHAKN